MDKYEDRNISHPTDPPTALPARNPNTHLFSFVEAMQLTYLWRIHHPIDKEYTFYSLSHMTFSRNDYIFVTQATLNLVELIDIKDIVISDHTPVMLEIRDPTPPLPIKALAIPVPLSNPTKLPEFLREWDLYLDLNQAHTTDRTLFWEVGKAYMKGLIIAYVTAYRKEKSTQFFQAGNRVREAQQKYQSTKSEQCREECNQARKFFETSQALLWTI